MTIIVAVAAFILGYSLACATPHKPDTRTVTKSLIDSYTLDVVKRVIGEDPKACYSGYLNKVAYLYSYFCGWDAPEVKPAVNWLLGKGWYRTRDEDGRDCYYKDGRMLSVRIQLSSVTNKPQDRSYKSVDILQHTGKNSRHAHYVGKSDPAQILEDMRW